MSGRNAKRLRITFGRDRDAKRAWAAAPQRGRARARRLMDVRWCAIVMEREARKDDGVFRADDVLAKYSPSLVAGCLVPRG